MRCCCAPSWRSRSIRRRSASAASTTRLRDARNSFTWSSTRASSVLFQPASSVACDSSCSYRRPSSSFIRLRFAASAPSSSRFGTSRCLEKSPDAISARRSSVFWIGPTTDHASTDPRSSASTTLATPATMKMRREFENELWFSAMSAVVSAWVAPERRLASAPSSFASGSARACWSFWPRATAPTSSKAMILSRTRETCR